MARFVRTLSGDHGKGEVVVALGTDSATGGICRLA